MLLASLLHISRAEFAVLPVTVTVGGLCDVRRVGPIDKSDDSAALNRRKLFMKDAALALHA